MIDVVFLLIVFFIVSSSMIKEEASMPLDLPTAWTGQKAEPQETGKIVINVNPEGHLFLGIREVTREELHHELVRQKQESKLPLEIRIRTARTVPYRIIEPVLVTCARAGTGNVSFAVIDRAP